MGFQRPLPLFSIVVGALLLSAAKPITEADIGPAPTFADAVAMTEQAVREKLFDPASAQFDWSYDLTPGSLKARRGQSYIGWITCGLVNSKDRTGAQTGWTYFEAVIHNGSIEMLDLGTTDFFGADVVGASCKRLIEENFLHRR